MKLSFGRARAIAAGGLLLATTALVADGTRFSDFTPLTSSAGPTADESQPITFGNPDFQQRSITSRQVQLAAGIPNSGSFDMITVNETGHDKGRFLFTVFETGQSGVQRHDLANGTTDTRLVQPDFRRRRGVRRVLLDAVGHADHRRGELGRPADRPARTAGCSS